MKIAMLGSLGNINRIVIPKLVADGHQVTVVTTNKKRASQISDIGAVPAVGSMGDINFLNQVFNDKDLVYLMISGANGNIFENAKIQSQKFKKVIQENNIKKVVDLSSIGSRDNRAGSLYAYHYIEEALESLNNVDVAFVRPMGFYNNLYANIPAIKKNHAIYSPLAPETIRKWAAPEDIAIEVYRLISNLPKGKSYHFVVSDTINGKEMVKQFSKSLNIPDLKYIQISDDQYYQSIIKNGVPEDFAKSFLTTTQFEKHPEELYKDLKDDNTYQGKVKFSNFAKKFAIAAKTNDPNAKSHTIADNNER